MKLKEHRKFESFYSIVTTNFIMGLYMFIVVAIYGLHHLVGHDKLKNHLIEALFVFPYTYITLHVFAKCWSSDSVMISKSYNHVGFLIELEQSFYVGYLLVDYMRWDWEQCLHHIIALLMFWMGDYSGYHQMVLTFLTIMSLSNPLLTASKIAYKLEMWKTSKVVFTSFAIVFFMCRCVGYGVFIWMYCRNIPSNISTMFYTAAMTLTIGLYIMQCIWMRRIVCLLLKSNQK